MEEPLNGNSEKGVPPMKKMLVVGAGAFGRQLVRELSSRGCAVDVVDTDKNVDYALRGTNCRVFHNNAWNLAFMSETTIPDYDCCYICTAESPSINARAIGALRDAGAKRIVMRVKKPSDAPHYIAAGADSAVCPDELAARLIADGEQAAGPSAAR